MEVNSQLQVSAALTRYALNRRLDRPQGRSERFWKSEKPLSSAATEPIL